MLDIHKNIYEKLDYYIDNDRIPNIIFHGSCGSGKRTILNTFIKKIYVTNTAMKTYVLTINCAYNKGIKFIREELKFFSKSHINTHDKCHFKSIILLNAEQLTMDAQSALRRCIELFSHSTRFFIVVENKYKLLKPILSRFCEIYIPNPNNVNLHQHIITNRYKIEQNNWLKNKLDKFCFKTVNEITEFSEKLYEKGYHGLDLINYLLKLNIDEVDKYKKVLFFNKIKKEFRHEKLYMTIILFFLRSDYNLENVSYM